MRRQAGFTLIELMIAVAVIAILAAIAVPAWMKESSQTKARSEVSTIFSEISNREEQYLAENSAFMPAAGNTTGFCPAAPSSTGSADSSPCIAPGQPWYLLRMQVPTQYLYCTYNITTGDATTAPPSLPAWVTPPVAAPANSWFFIIAWCDMDGSSTTDSYYYFASYDTKIQSTNEGT